MIASKTIAVVDDESFDAHRAPRKHVECPERLDAARSGVARALGGAARTTIAAREVREDEILRVHSREHLRALEDALRGSFGSIDADTYVAPGSRAAAWRAAGGAAELARALMEDRAQRGFALLRPPGHHAERDRAMGFCLLNNVAIAATAALDAGAQRVAIVDWDVHHGNGTQDAFEADPRVMFVSLHQWPLYPGTGAPGEIGRGAGVGTTANLAMPPGSGPEEYGQAFRRVVLPLVSGFAPDLVLVSAGYDAHASDPLASMRLDAASYGAMATALIDVAEQLGHGRVGFVLEGGYDLQALESSVDATVRAALGERVALPEGRTSGTSQAALDHTIRALAPHRPELR
ncbi:histone deacetylase [Sandaracinus amylolyticus]|uniref:histone deacetylase family protein n=1 Tax=Sandaracinus amylolyticus TaxID=927083 RepID=UPI001F422F5D|nr:histone deacetylase [Sandaracinus amylolyticus]UJR80345.1 Acetoin utilization deacetylase AcuC [Sandaracinus amylolyticus]